MIGDCLDLMEKIPVGSVDMVLCDLPYGTTDCKWDSIIPLTSLWQQYFRIIKPKGNIVLTATQPFTTALIGSNISKFRYSWSWDKKVATGFSFCKYQPLRAHEDICVFGEGGGVYNPQMIERTQEELKRFSKNVNVYGCESQHYNGIKKPFSPTRDNNKFKNPNSVIRITGVINRSKEKVDHPTQKPVSLMEYLIRTYTNEGEIVLDNTMGSGTTGVACVNTARRFIGIERDEKYFEIAQRRITQATTDVGQPVPLGGLFDTSAE